MPTPTPANYRDKKLQLTSPRINPVNLDSNVTVPTGQVTGLTDLILNSKTVTLKPSSQVFQISKAGVGSPLSIVIYPLVRNLTGVSNWSVSSGTGTLTANTDGSRTLTLASMTTDTVSVTLAVNEGGVTYSDTVTIAKLREGNNAVTPLLTNEAATFAATAAGAVSDFTVANGVFKVFDGTTDKSGSANGTTYVVASATSGTTAAITTAGAYSVSAMGTDSATVTLQATYNGLVMQKVLTLAKSKAGADAITMNITATAAVFSRATASLAYAPTSATLSATPSSGTATYQWQYWDGTTWQNVASATSANLVVASGDFTGTRTYRVQGTVAGKVYMNQMTLTQVTGGANGTRGSVTVNTYTASTSWVDAEAAAAIANNGFGSPVQWDVVNLFNNLAFDQKRYWNGSTWVVISQRIVGNLLVDGSVGAQALAANAITASKIVVSSDADNIFPDEAFRDLAWWGRPNATVDGPYPSGNFWKNGYCMELNPTKDGVEQNTVTSTVPLLPGATYRLEMQVFISSDFSGALSVWLHIPNVRWQDFGTGITGNFFSDGVDAVQFFSGSPKGTLNYATTTTIPLLATLSDNSAYYPTYTQIRIHSKVDAGYIQIGSIKMTRVSDSVLIKDGAITAAKISVQNLRAITATIGFFQSAAVGNPRVEISDGQIETKASNNVTTVHIGA